MALEYLTLSLQQLNASVSPGYKSPKAMTEPARLEIVLIYGYRYFSLTMTTRARTLPEVKVTSVVKILA